MSELGAERGRSIAKKKLDEVVEQALTNAEIQERTNSSSPEQHTDESKTELLAEQVPDKKE